MKHSLFLLTSSILASAPALSFGGTAAHNFVEGITVCAILKPEPIDTEPDSVYLAIVETIVSKVGVPTHGFTLESGAVPNALADIRDGKRVIYYNPRFMRELQQNEQTDWGAVGVLAHEIGHHMCGHPFDSISVGSQPQFELEADEFSGFVMARMGATLEQAKMGVGAMPDVVSTTHPAKAVRFAAVERGWQKGKISDEAGEEMKVYTSAANVAVEPQSTGAAIGAIRLKRGEAYLIEVKGDVQLDDSRQVWGGCGEHAVWANYDATAELRDAFEDTALASPAILPSFKCGPGSIEDFQSQCKAWRSFQGRFVVPELQQDIVCQLVLTNRDTKVGYHHTCGPNNPEGGFTAAVVMRSGLTATVTTRPRPVEHRVFENESWELKQVKSIQLVDAEYVLINATTPRLANEYVNVDLRFVFRPRHCPGGPVADTWKYRTELFANGEKLNSYTSQAEGTFYATNESTIEYKGRVRLDAEGRLRMYLNTPYLVMYDPGPNPGLEIKCHDHVEIASGSHLLVTAR